MYVHEVLVKRLIGLSLPKKSVVRLTDRLDMTLDVYCGRKTTIQQQQQLYQKKFRVTRSIIEHVSLLYQKKSSITILTMSVFNRDQLTVASRYLGTSCHKAHRHFYDSTFEH